jgi:hypothetical protein
MKKMILVLMGMLMMAGAALAAETDAAPHPKAPENATWALPLVIFILGMFAVAWVVGLVVRAMMPEEVPPTHAHDEHHGHRDPNDHPELHDPHDGHGHGHAAHGH